MGRRQKAKNPPLGWTRRQQWEIEAEKGRGGRKANLTTQAPPPPIAAPTLDGIRANLEDNSRGLDPYRLVLDGRFEEAIADAGEILAEGLETDA